MAGIGTLRRGIRHPGRLAREALQVLAVLVVGVIAGLVVTSSPGSADQPQLSEFTLTGPSITPEGGNTTFTWTLAWSGAPHHDPDDDEVSHVLIDTCLGATAVSSNSNGYEDPDGHGDTGYKWETSNVGDTFSITYPGTVAGGGTASAVIAKAGEHSRFSVAGPSCVETTTTTGATTTTTGAATTTVPVVVAGVVVQAPPTVAGEVSRAAPEELAFTGGGDQALAMTLGGLAGLALGLILVIMSRRASVGVRFQR